MNPFGEPAAPRIVLCDRKCRFSQAGRCIKRTQSRSHDSRTCPFFLRIVEEDPFEEEEYYG